MNRDRITVAFTIGMFNAIDGPAYCVYTQAYGLEMTIDEEWPVNTIMMAPPHLVSAMTRWADVTSMGVIAGASYTPGDGDYRQIKENDGQWVLARPTDDLSRILTADLGILLVIRQVEELSPLLANDLLNETNLIVALQINSVSTVPEASESAAQIKSLLTNRNLGTGQILISGSSEHTDIVTYGLLPNIDGLLLLDCGYENILDIIARLTSSRT